MKLLIIGKLEGQIGAASAIALKSGAEVLQASSVAAAMDILCSGKGVDVVFFDVKEDIQTFMTALESSRIKVPVYACGVENNAKLAVAAIRAGAKDYIPMPPDAELIGEVFTQISLAGHSLIFKDPKMVNVVTQVEQFAKSEANIMITGESGTGKEVIARHIHARSKRSKNRFVAINCAAIPENLLESELFGYEKGAFTGAVSRRIGKFEEANGGTLLLDEISEMHIELQAKLLRAIQEKEIDRLGGKAPIKVDVRILATSNRNMMEAVKNKTFREDLYYRLNVVAVALPPLRERKGDILPLCEHFIAKYSEINEMPVKPLTAAATAKLNAYSYPGNVRELENIVQRAVILSTGSEIDADAVLLGETVQPPADETHVENVVNTYASFKPMTMAMMEQNLILDTLKYTAGNRTNAANILGISIRTLRNKIKQYMDEGIDVPKPVNEE